MTRPKEKHIHVTCAIIEHQGRVLAAQRSSTMAMPLKWEFPGGKIHPGETPEDCLKRELVEEMNIRVGIIRALPSSDYRYPDFSLTLHPFVCRIEAGHIILHEHSQILWLFPEALPELDWTAADVPVVQCYLACSGRDPL